MANIENEIMSVDASGFAKQLTALSAYIETSVEKIINKVVFDLFQMIVGRTAKDTGRLMSSWSMKSETPGDEEAAYPEEMRITRSQAFTNAMNNRRGWKWEIQDDEIWIFNNIHYASYIEGGHSQQAPEGMVAISLATIEAHLQREVSKYAGIEGL